MKKTYIELDSDNFIIGWSLERYSDTAIEIDYPEEFYGKLGFVKYVNGVLSVDEDKKNEISKETPTVDGVAKTVDNLCEQVTKGQDDISELQLAITELYEAKQNNESEVEQNG